jgi:SAM-dependent methyltransferase
MTDINQTTGWNNFWKTNHKDSISPSWSKKRIIEILLPFIKTGSKVIDAGCGSGFFSEFFQNNSLQVLALDTSEAALELCQNRCSDRLQTVKFDLLNQSISNKFGNEFDLVFSDGLLEHFSTVDQIRLLTNFASSTLAGGKIVTIVPNRFSPWQILRTFMMPGIKEVPFTLKKLIRINNLAGIKVCRAGGLNVLPTVFSPEKLLGSSLGMLLYTIGERAPR